VKDSFATRLGELITPARLPRAGKRDLPLLSMTMKDGLVDQSSKFKKRVASDDTSQYKVVKRGQLVVGFPIDEGVLAFQRVYDEGIVSPAYAIWDVVDQQHVDSAYLERYLRSPVALAYYATKLRSTTARRRSLPTETFLDLPIYLPPLGIQRRVSGILDIADAILRKRKRAIALLDGLTQSIFVEMFGDPKSKTHGFPERRLEDVADFYAGNSLPTATDFSGQAEGHLLIKVSDMNLPGNEEWIVRSALWSSVPGSRASTCPAGSVVFPKRGGAIYTNKKRRTARPAILDPNVMGVAPKTDLLSEEYLYEWFRALDLGEITSGSSVPQLNKQDLAPLLIALPPKTLQLAYLGKKKQHEVLRNRAGVALQRAQHLYSTLQHRAFSGEL
jgi:type I restriction enzyme S subunit